MLEVPEPTSPQNQGERKTPKPISRRAFDEWMERAPSTIAPGDFRPDHTLRNIIISNGVAVLIVVLTVVFSAGGIRQEISSLTDWKKQVTSDMAQWQHAYDEKINRIDSAGTQSGNASMRLIEQKNLEQDRRLNDMQADMSKIVPDLRELKTKLDDAIYLLQDGKPGKMTNR